MEANIVTTDKETFEFPEAGAAFYSETTDTFVVRDKSGKQLFEKRMGDIAELEIYHG